MVHRYNYGVALGALQEDGEAAAYRQALSLQKDHADSLANLGVALAERRGRGFADDGAGGAVDHQAELANYRAALAVEPGHLAALNGLGACLAEMGDWAGAEGAFRGAIAAHPTDLPSWRNLVRLLRKAGKDDAAAAVMKEAQAAFPRPDGAEKGPAPPG